VIGNYNLDFRSFRSCAHWQQPNYAVTNSAFLGFQSFLLILGFLFTPAHSSVLVCYLPLPFFSLIVKFPFPFRNTFFQFLRL